MRTDKNILIAFVLNILFSIFEFIGGLFTGSVAILSDSLHDFGDALSIGISYLLEKKSKRKADLKYTYGYIRYSVIGGFITSTILFSGSLFVIYESIKRIINPVAINYDGMIVIAFFGVIINLFAAYFTKEGDSINQKSVNLHMLEDVLGWIVVLIGSILMHFTNIVYIDAILSILVAIFIIIHTFDNIKSILDLFLEKTPSNVNLNRIKQDLLKIDGVLDIHHIHVRSIDGYNNFLTLHVVLNDYDKKIKTNIKKKLLEHNIIHSTIEIELENEKCSNITCDGIKIHNNHHHHHHKKYLILIIILIINYTIVNNVYATQLTAHRGASFNYSENTVSSFVGAKIFGANWIELDVQQTKDGKIVISHDKNIFRITGIDKQIIDLTYDELSMIDFDYMKKTFIKKENIPVLEDVIRYAKKNGIKLNIELKLTGKESNFEKQVIDLIKKYDYIDMCIISTNSYRVAENIKKIDNNIKIAYVAYKSIDNIEDYKYVDIFSIDYSYVNQELVNNIHKLGKEIHVWTVNNEVDINRMLDINVDNIITNDIELAIKLKMKKDIICFI